MEIHRKKRKKRLLRSREIIAVIIAILGFFTLLQWGVFPLIDSYPELGSLIGIGGLLLSLTVPGIFILINRNRI